VSDVRVVYVAGARRSGSTLVGRVAGSLPGATITGEVRLVWAATVEERPCTCLHAVRVCPFWSTSVERALSASSVANARDLFAIQSTRLRERELPRVMRWRYGRDAELDRLARATRALYEAIAHETGATTVVDSSKSPAYVTFLQRVPGLDVRGLHLVRHPARVIDSWSREKTWTHGEWSESLFARPARQAATDWAATNLATELALARAPRMRRLRFEDFLADPRGALTVLADLAGLPMVDLEGMSADGRTITIAPHHEIAGNIDRFETGPVTIATPTTPVPDISRSLRALTAPLARRYGY